MTTDYCALPAIPARTPVRRTGVRVRDLTARRTAVMVLAVDAILGMGWLLGAPNRSKGPVYQPVRDLLTWLPGDPARWWGGILLVLVIVTLFSMRFASEIHARRCFALLFVYWSMWATAYVIGAFTQDGAAWAPIGYSLMCCIGNRRVAVAPQRVSIKAR